MRSLLILLLGLFSVTAVFADIKFNSTFLAPVSLNDLPEWNLARQELKEALKARNLDRGHTFSYSNAELFLKTKRATILVDLAYEFEGEPLVTPRRWTLFAVLRDLDDNGKSAVRYTDIPLEEETAVALQTVFDVVLLKTCNANAYSHATREGPLTVLSTQLFTGYCTSFESDSDIAHLVDNLLRLVVDSRKKAPDALQAFRQALTNFEAEAREFEKGGHVVKISPLPLSENASKVENVFDWSKYFDAQGRFLNPPS